MKFKYQFVDEAVDVEIDETWGAILLDLERREYNNNQAQTRRHASLQAMEYEGETFVDLAADVIALVERAETCDAVRRAMDSLQPQQKALLQKVFFEGIPAAEIARQEGVNKSSIHKRLQRIFEQLKIVLP